MGNTNAVIDEEYGWFRCANWAANELEIDDETLTQNADSYAWYAECELSSVLISGYDGCSDTIVDGWWVRQLRSNGFDVHDPWPNDGPHKKPYNYAS